MSLLRMNLCEIVDDDGKVLKCENLRNLIEASKAMLFVVSEKAIDMGLRKIM